MDAPGNGNYVTWRELTLALKPIEAKVDTVGGKVDSVLLKLARDDGIHEGSDTVRRSFLDSTRFWISTMVVMFTGTIGAVATIVWLKA